MSRQRFNLFWLGAVPALLLNAAGAEPAPTPVAQVTYETLPKLVQERNERVRAAGFAVEAAEIRTGSLARSYLPQIQAGGGWETFQKGSFGQLTQPFASLEARVNLFRGGRDALSEGARRRRVDAAVADREESHASELSKARRAFWYLAFQEETQAILEEALKENETNLAAANRRISGGLATKTDRIEFELNRTRLDRDRAKLRLESENVCRELMAFLALPAEAEVALPPAIPHEHDPTLLDASLDATTHRLMRGFEASRETAELEASQARRWWTPSLDVYAAHTLSTFRTEEQLRLRDRLETVAGFRVTLPLFDGLQGSAEARARAAEADAIENQSLHRRRELVAELESAKTALKLFHELIHAEELRIEQGRQYLQGTLQEYSRGTKNSPDVLGAANRYLEYREHSAELRRDYQLAKAALLGILSQ